MPFDFPARSSFYDLRIVGIALTFYWLLILGPLLHSWKNGGTGRARAKKMGISLEKTIR